MSKALKLLKEQLRLRSKYKGVSSMKQLIKETAEAIAELEEAMKPKTCEGCKYQKIDIDRCGFCKRYYSDQYSPKE